MADKKTIKKQLLQKKAPAQPEGQPTGPKIPPELEGKVAELKTKLDKFKEEALKKFDKYVMGIALLPPPKEPKPEDKDMIDVLILIDDTEPSKMPKQELFDKLASVFEEIAKGIDTRIRPRPLLLTELWQNMYDGKYDMLQVISYSAPIFDKGMLAALKISEIHKQMTLKKFEKYIVSYVLAGSLVQGRATAKSDIDVFIVVDDTDVKKMTRFELRDKLRAIIIGMGMEAGAMTGIQNKLNIQVYILTDFWESIREANPVIFTFLRDGIPLFDRGIFMPWKLLLKMGKIKPSPEAIDMYLSSGEQGLDRVKAKLKDICTEDFYWSIITPSQAALMMYGIPPPAYWETPDLMEEIFVKKEKMMKKEEVDTLRKVIKIRKDIEHGEKQEATGIEVDELSKACENYLKRIKDLFGKIQARKDEESVLKMYDDVLTVVRDALVVCGIERAFEDEVLHVFEEELISTGKVPSKFLRQLHEIMKAKEKYNQGKLTATEIEESRKAGKELFNFLVDFIQGQRIKELKKVKFRFKTGEHYGEINLLGNTAYVIREGEDQQLQKAEIKPDGSLGPLQNAKIEEFEKAIANIAIPQRIAIRTETIASFKDLLGPNVELLF